MTTTEQAKPFALALGLIRAELEKAEKDRLRAEADAVRYRAEMEDAEQRLATNQAICDELSEAMTRLADSAIDHPLDGSLSPKDHAIAKMVMERRQDFTKPATGGITPKPLTPSVTIETGSGEVQRQPGRLSEAQLTKPAPAPIVAMCKCSHTQRRHDEVGCVASGCGCVEFRQAEAKA